MPVKKWLGKKQVVGILLGVGLAGLVVGGLSWWSYWRPNRTPTKQAITPMETGKLGTKQQVKRIWLKRWRDGAWEYTEIWENGKLCVYDEKMELKRCGRMGIARVRSLFLDMENRLGEGIIDMMGGGGNYEIWIETEKGRSRISGGGNNQDWDEIVDNIGYIEEQIFKPTPTTGPTLTPRPTQAVGPPVTAGGGALPTATPVLLPGEPTPLPGYLSAPPFSCEDYEFLNRPVTISNVICGVD